VNKKIWIADNRLFHEMPSISKKSEPRTGNEQSLSWVLEILSASMNIGEVCQRPRVVEHGNICWLVQRLCLQGSDQCEINICSRFMSSVALKLTGDSGVDGKNQ
jgi:hypothetical protein